MKRRYLEAKNLDNMSVEEVCTYFREYKHFRLKELYRFKQEAEDEAARVFNKMKQLKIELENLKRQATIDREASADIPNCTLYLQ